MPRKKKPPQAVLENVKYEMLAQELADGRHRVLAYLLATEPDVDPELHHATLAAHLAKHDQNLGARARAMCVQPEVKQRVATILAERQEKRLAVKMADIKMSSAIVTNRLTEVVDRCMQVVPVINRQGNAIGTYRFEPQAAVKALELLGLEQGMFERKHKHLHAKANRLDGNRSQIVGRLGVLLDQLSAADLESIGLQRIDTVEIRVDRVDGVGGQQGPAIPAVSEAS
jgi:hypothetical protein